MLILKYLLNEIIKNIVNYRIINSEQLPDAHVFHIGWIVTIYFNNIFPPTIIQASHPQLFSFLPFPDHNFIDNPPDSKADADTPTLIW